MKRPSQAGINKAKNAVRGTFNKPNATYLQQIKHYGAPRKSEADLILGGLASLRGGDVESFVEWLSGFPATKAAIFPRTPVRELAGLRFSNVESRMDLATRTIFVSLFLSEERSRLSDFDGLRLAIDSAIIGGEYADAAAGLDLVEEEFGLSLWGVELRIALLQLARGLEAQKEFANSLTNQAPRSAAAVIASWVSQRNEEGTIYARFRTRLKSAMLKWKTPSSITQAYSYLLGVEPLASQPDSSASFVLGAVSSVSLIDAYMVVRDGVSALVEDASPALPQVAAAYASAAPDSDILSLKLRQLLGLPSHPASEREQASPIGIGWLLDLQQAEQEEHGAEQAQPKMTAELRRLLSLARTRETGFASAVDSGLKRVANFRHLDLTRAVAAFVTLQEQATPVFRLSRATPLFLFSSDNSAWQALTVPSDVAGQLLQGSDVSGPREAILSALTSTSGSPLTDGTAREFAARAALTRGEPALALELLGEPSHRPEVERRSAPVRIEALLRTGDLNGAVTAAGNLCAAVDGARSLLPIADLISELRGARFKVTDSLALALLLHEVLDGSEDREVFQRLQFAYEDTLTAAGVDRPSDFAPASETEASSRITSFLWKVCLPPVMDVSFWLFKTTKDTLVERIAVCSRLIILDEPNRSYYQDEIKEITRVIEIAKGIEDVDKSRVFIDIDRLGRWAHNELSESFDRYKALTRAGFGYENPGEFERLLKDFLAGKDVSLSSVAEYPKDEAAQLLIEILQAIMDRYFNDEDFGLDAYLSMRVRHGSLAGHLRGPLEEAGILVARDKGTGRFPVSSEWSDFSQKIEKFSATYERLLDQLTKTRLQIKSAEHKDGLFGVELAPLSIYYVRSGIDESTTLDQLLSRFYDLLEIFMTRSLVAVREFITGSFRERAEEALADLACPDEVTAGTRYSDLQNAIAAASPDWQASVDRVASWFAPTEANERASLRTMDQIIEIAVQATKNAHRGFEPLLSLDIEDLGAQGPDVLVAFSDILFTALDNVHRHSGLGSSPAVRISLKAEQSTNDNLARVRLRIENDLHPEKKSDTLERRLSRIKGQIDSGDYKTRVKLEGGTGFLKLKRIVAPDDRQTLDFGFSGELFFVELEMIVVFLSDAGPTSPA